MNFLTQKIKLWYSSLYLQLGYFLSSLFLIRYSALSSIESYWDTIEKLGFSLLYAAEEDGEIEIVVDGLETDVLSHLPGFLSMTPWSPPPTDWEEQWALHCPHYQEGYALIELRDQLSIQLKPGPGFGDFSHPTTKIALTLLSSYLRKEIVIDIGSGSGILSIAAAKMGSPFVYGIEIDPQALLHAKENASFNHLETLVSFVLPEHFSLDQEISPLIIVMNMISSEQKNAWKSLPLLHLQKGLCLTTGIPENQTSSYLQQTAAWGWNLIEEVSFENWKGFCFLLPGTLS